MSADTSDNRKLVFPAFLTLLLFFPGAGFAATTAGTTPLSPGVLAVGNGTLGDYTGTLIAGMIGIATTSPQAKLDINGGVRVGADATCNAGKAGTLAWNSSSLQVCNGTSWSSLGGSGLAAGGTGAIQFANGTAFAGDATNFFWDNTNKRLGIGTTVPTSLLHLNGGTLRIDGGFDYRATTGGNSGRVGLYSNNDIGLIQLKDSNNNTVVSLYNAGDTRLANLTNNDFDISTNNIERLRITASGNVGIGTTSPQTTAALDVTSTTKGFLPPRMTTAQRDSISSPAAGLIIFNTTTNTLNFYDGSAWFTYFAQQGSPNAFSFTDVTGAAVNATVSSNAVTVTGFAGSLTATCTGCTAIARNGAWGGTTVNGFTAGDNIAIRVTSSASNATAVTATATLGGTTSGTWTVTTVSATGPNAFSFTDVSDASTGVTYTSNTVTLSGFYGSLTATCNSCTGIGRNGVWGVSPLSGFVSGDTIAIRQTSAAGAGSASSASVTLGSTTSGTWSVTTASACSVGIIAGQACPDGTLFAGFTPDGNVPMYTTRCDAGQSWSGSACTGTRTPKIWNNGSSNWTDTGYTSATTGRANTTGLAALLDAGGPYQAVKYCEDLVSDGHSDWYLPARSELSVFYANAGALGNFLTDGSWYWSSSEYVVSTAWFQRFSDGYQDLNGVKSNGIYVRCARR